MRSRATNILQVILIVNGIVFVAIGIFLYFSPLTVLRLFAANIPDNWLDLVRDNEFVAPLYYYIHYVSSGLAALLFTSGFAMVLPIFDPLRYRGLIYFNGIVFPFFASVPFVKDGLVLILTSRQPGQEAGGSFLEFIRNQGSPLFIFILGLIFLAVFISTLIAILITRKQAKQGIE